MYKAVSNHVQVSASGQPILTFTDGTRVGKVSAVDTSRGKIVVSGPPGVSAADTVESITPQFQSDPQALWKPRSPPRQPSRPTIIPIYMPPKSGPKKNSRQKSKVEIEK